MVFFHWVFRDAATYLLRLHTFKNEGIAPHIFCFFSYFPLLPIFLFFRCNVAITFSFLQWYLRQTQLHAQTMDILCSNIFFFKKSLFFQTCDPFLGPPTVRALSSSLFYFVPTMALMYGYGSVFHLRHLRRVRERRRQQQQQQQQQQHGKKCKRRQQQQQQQQLIVAVSNGSIPGRGELKIIEMTKSTPLSAKLF